jgi:endoglucanase
MWNTSATPCRGNVIEFNHIHHVMQMLSDGGGIYTLGRQPETVLRANLIHDVPLNAGRAESNGMFIDEGSSDILIEQNTIFNTARSPIRFHQATGDTVRNNVLVTPADVPTFRYNATDEKSMTYEGNQAPDPAEWTPPASLSLLAGLEREYRRRSVASSADGTSDAFPYNRMLGRGVNLGNALEAPREGAWGLTLKDSYFSEIKRAGFQSVRIPIRWSAHAEAAAPYRIDEEFFERIDWVVNTALESGLVAVINMHHYDDIFEAPDEHRQRFVQIWQQIALRYRSHSDRLYFELLNEPHANLNSQRWNDYLLDVLQVVRETNPDRIVIIGPAGWNNPAQLPRLELPEDDRRLIVTFHYYNPFQFTHQGANWVADSDRWRGKRWEGSEQEQQAVRDDFEKAAQWAAQANRPLYLGEFGAYREAPMASRTRWMRCVRDEAERQGMSWAYWEFASGFGVFDPAENQWRTELLDALTGDSSRLTP